MIIQNPRSTFLIFRVLMLEDTCFEYVHLNFLQHFKSNSVMILRRTFYFLCKLFDDQNNNQKYFDELHISLFVII